MGSVRTFMLGGPRPPTRLRRAHSRYAVICEEPVFGYRDTGRPVDRRATVSAVEPPQVRVATESDTESLAQLFAHVQALHRDALPWEFIDPDVLAAEHSFAQQMTDPEVLVLLAYRDEEPIGYLLGKELHRQANLFTAATSFFHVHQMAVTPDARRSGVGRALMGAAEAEAAKRGLAGVRLNTWAFNTSAHRFFERLGYAPYNIAMQRMFDRSDER